MGSLLQKYRANYEVVALLLIMTIALILRVYRSDMSLWFDEILTAVDIKYYFHNLLMDRTQVVEVPLWSWDHPPLYFIAAKLSTELFGESEFTLRLPAIIAGVVSVYAIHRFTTLLYDSSTAGIVAAFLIAVNPFHIYYSQEARPYSFLMLTTIMSSIFLHRIIFQGRARHYIFYAVTSIAGFYTHYFFIIVWFVQTILIVILLHHRDRLIFFTLASAAAWLAFLSLWRGNFSIFLTREIERTITVPIQERFLFLLSSIARALGTYHFEDYFLPAITLVLVLATYLADRKVLRVSIISISGSLLYLAVLFTGARVALNPGYVSPAVVLCYAAVSGAISVLMVEKNRFLTFTVLGILVAITFTNALALAKYYHTPIYKDDHKAAFQAIMQRLRPGDIILYDRGVENYKGTYDSYYADLFGLNNHFISTYDREDIERITKFYRGVFYVTRTSNAPAAEEMQRNGCHVIFRKSTFVCYISAAGDIGESLRVNGNWEEVKKYYSQKGDNFGLFLTGKLSGNLDWQLYGLASVSLQDPQSEVISDHFRVAAHAWLSNTGFDSIYSSRYNLLNFGSFENGSDFWTPDNESHNAQLENGSLCVESFGKGYHGGPSASIAVEPGRLYVFAGYFRAVDYGDFKGRLLYWENTGSYMLGWEEFVGSIDDYRLYWTLVSVDQSIVHLRPALIQGAGKLCMDNMIFIDLSQLFSERLVRS